jgi:cysteine desulfurase
MRRIYLDHAATAPLEPSVRKKMLPWLDCGNASSLSLEGRRAKAAIDEAREVIAEALGCEFGEVIFTSGATEAANAAILGIALRNQAEGRSSVAISSAEHHCVIETGPLLRRLGVAVKVLPADGSGLVDPECLAGLEPGLLCAMHANNELGSIADIKKISRVAKAAGLLFFCDAVQTFMVPGCWPFGKLAQMVDLAAISAHKIGGPKGIGALYVRAGLKPVPLAVGGGQEREMRAGTENVAAIVGFAEAVKLRRKSQETRLPLRDRFLAALRATGAVPSLMAGVPCLPGHVHVRWPGIQAETLLIRLDQMGIAAASGAACSSGSTEPSHVLLAAGYSVEEAKEGVRFSFGLHTAPEDLDEAARRIAEAVSAIRRMHGVG